MFSKLNTGLFEKVHFIHQCMIFITEFDGTFFFFTFSVIFLLDFKLPAKNFLIVLMVAL